MTIIHYSEDTFLSAAAPNLSCWQSRFCASDPAACAHLSLGWAPQHITATGLATSTAPIWRFLPARGLVVLLQSLPLLATSCTGGLQLLQKDF